ncbi:MAG: acyl-homoserine-lactone synthase, partial [Bacteroidota bacterium]
MNIVSRDRNISSTLAQGPNLRTRILRIPRGMSLDELATMGTIKDYLALRKSVFTRKKGWDVWLPKDNDLDQYDQYDSVYVIAQHA